MSHTPGAFAKKFQCPCCNNPWNQSESADNVATFYCSPCLADDKGYKGIDPSNFDQSIPLNENFYKWSNGGWMKNNPIPGAYSSWNTFIVLRDLNLERLRTILDDLASGSIPSTSGTQKLADYFNAFMDEDTISHRSLEPMIGMAALCSKSMVNPTSAVAAIHAKYGVTAFFGMYSSPDKSNSQHSLCNLYQSGLGMPDRDYYFDADKTEKRGKYVEYITQLLHLVGQEQLRYQHLQSGVDEGANSDSDSARGFLGQYAERAACERIARDIMAFETQIAALHLTRTASRDPQLTYNKMSIDTLADMSKPTVTWSQYLSSGVPSSTARFDWHGYFESIGKPAPEMEDVNVSAVTLLTGFARLLSHPCLPHYLFFLCLNSCAPHLPTAFADAHFVFHEHELKGTSEQLPRWKRALQGLETALGEELGQLYVARHFPSDAKQHALEVVESVRDALRERLLEVDWMSTETRKEALLKMERFEVKIGFPDSWIDYSGLAISPGRHMENVLAGRQFAFKLELSRMNAPTDRSRWLMTPQTVNAYYHPSLNEIVFPAAILQPPFFDAEADRAVQYGSLGAVVGHEMTHGFDDQGRKYDSEGTLRDWWAHGDGSEYERRVEVMIRQAEQFEVHGQKLNGKLTCGENIADLGGVKLALRALREYLEKNPQPATINGFTPFQRFFLSWAQAWRENVRKERALQLVTLDPHGPNELRCNGTLRNVPEFLQAFGIIEGDPMFLPEAARVDIW